MNEHFAIKGKELLFDSYEEAFKTLNQSLRNEVKELLCKKGTRTVKTPPNYFNENSDYSADRISIPYYYFNPEVSISQLIKAKELLESIEISIIKLKESNV